MFDEPDRMEFLGGEELKLSSFVKLVIFAPLTEYMLSLLMLARLGSSILSAASTLMVVSVSSCYLFSSFYFMSSSELFPTFT